MSTFDADDLKTAGYFLPEDSQLRLKKLREYADFLSHLAQPRRTDAGQEAMPEISAGEVAICLELLAEQMGLVLDDIAWPAYRSGSEAAAVAGVEPAAAREASGNVGGRYLFGVTLDQIDAINLLLDMIRAHGDVVIASHEAEFADRTLSLVGHAIFCDAQKLREIIDDVNAQELEPTHGTKPGVREERATYHALPARWLMGRVSHVARQLPTYQ